PARHPLPGAHLRLRPGLAASPGHAHAWPAGTAGRRHPRRGPHPVRGAALVRGPERRRRADRGAGREGPRPPHRGRRGELLRGRGPGPLRVRVRHGLLRAGSQPAGDLRPAGVGAMAEASIALAVIGGTGLYRLAGLEDARAERPETPYGEPSGPLRVGTIDRHPVAFLARHGEAHSVPPHRINYRANLAALAGLGARRVLALNTVGG